MKEVAPIDFRKSKHIKINLKKDVRSDLTSGLEHYHFIHEGLPEIDFSSIDTSLKLFGKKLNAPILISSMTGGTEEAILINRILAEAAQSVGIAMGVGSQRAAIDNSRLVKSFSIVRKAAPDILLFANLGAVQLNYNYSIDQYRLAVDMIQADALFLHLNPLQEALQLGGNTNYSGLAKKIEEICKTIKVPVVVKEVGWGISERTAKVLVDCGVSGIDVAGAGGTSWSQVEMYSAQDELSRKLAATFVGWGIPTAESIINVKKATRDLLIFASGGIRDGLDISKSIALGATIGGMAGIFLKAAVGSTDKVIDLLNLTKRQIEVTMFVTGSKDINSLNNKVVFREY
jgi:isopentenyl-diphosphate delta-isomerase